MSKGKAESKLVETTGAAPFGSGPNPERTEEGMDGINRAWMRSLAEAYRKAKDDGLQAFEDEMKAQNEQAYAEGAQRQLLRLADEEFRRIDSLYRVGYEPDDPKWIAARDKARRRLLALSLESE